MRDAVNVALHHVSAQSIAHCKRALEIDALARAPRTNCSPLERGNHGGHCEPTVAAVEDGKAGAIEGDALPWLEIGVRAMHSDLETGRCAGNSLNGTYVNHTRIDMAELQQGDELQIGKFRLVFFQRADG